MDKKKIKKKLLTLLFVLLNAGIILYTALSEFGGNDTATKFRDVQVQWIFLLPALGCLIAAILVESVKYNMVMKSTVGESNFKLSCDTVILGRYYDNITPSGIGGQPFQIWYMNKNGINPAQSAAIPLSGFLSMQYSFIIVAVLVFTLGARFLTTDVVRIAGYVGICLYAIFPTAILIATLCRGVFSKILNFLVNFLSLLHIVKEKDKTKSAIEENVYEYSDCIKSLIKKPLLVVKMMLLSILYQIFLMSIPFFVVYAFGGSLNFFECFCTIVSIYCAITIVPTPGNSGAAEGSFYAVFSMLSSGFVFWAMLFWRILVFYSYIGMGLLIYLRDYIVEHKNKKPLKEAEPKED